LLYNIKLFTLNGWDKIDGFSYLWKKKTKLLNNWVT
jgi:hypothetical protein